MNNMNRRSFMKGLAGVVVGVSVLKAAEPPEPKKTTVEKPSMNECIGIEVIFHNRRIWSCYGGKRICWAKVGDIQSWEVDGYIDIPTYDTFSHFARFENRLLWYGDHEVWEVCHIGGTLVFVCQFVGQIAMGSWRPSAGIDPNSDWAKTQIIALEDIPKGKYGWVRIGQQWEADI